MKKFFYITTALPYVNADPHIGFAMEIIRADVITRAKKLQGFDVFFNTGTDEHGQKIWNDAQKAGLDVKDYIDKYAKKFHGLIDLLQISPDVHFIRTTDKNHQKSAIEFWKICDKNGYIYKKSYKIKYCVGCELEKTDSELIDGKCSIHPNREIELIDEENYFFKFSAFQEKLLKLYSERPDFVVPDFRLNEIKMFVERGIEDFSISRLKSKMPWGIPVPGDSEQVMYVWFDALVNYISTLNWPEKKENFEEFWVKGTPTQYCGKDNLRMQSAMWQAMLMAAGLPNSGQIVINGFFTGEGGMKMSKSIGNIVNPYDVVEKYGAEALRYYVCAGVSMFEDSPVSMDLIHQSYNAKLANGLGNFVSRVMKMAENYQIKYDIPVSEEELIGTELSIKSETTTMQNYRRHLEKYELNKAVELIWQQISFGDGIIQKEKPFELIKTNRDRAKVIVANLLQRVYRIAIMLEPFLPETSGKIKILVKTNKSPEKPLFLRKE